MTAAYRIKSAVARVSARQLAVSGALVSALVIVSVLVGLLTVLVSGFAVTRPLFLLTVPLLLVLGFAFVLAPKALVVGILLVRACMDPVLAEARVFGAAGPGALIILVLVLLAAVLTLREPQRVPRVAWLIWLPLMAVQAIGLGHAPDLAPALRSFIVQMAAMATFLLAFHLVSDWKSFDRALMLIIAASLPVTIYTLVGIATGNVDSSLDGIEVISNRYRGPFTHPNILAFYVVLLIGVLLYLWKSPRVGAGTAAKVAIVGYILVLLVLLVATKTRSAWVAAAALFFVYGLLAQRRFLLYLLLASLLAMLVPEVRDRVLDLRQGVTPFAQGPMNSWVWRRLIWSDGLSWMEPLRYLVGYGAGGFYFHSPTFFSKAAGHHGAHNVLVELFFDFGVAGVVAFLLMFWLTLKTVVSGRVQDRELAILFGALAVSYVIVSLSDNMLAYGSYNWYFWFAMGAACSAVLHARGQLVATRAPSKAVRRRHGLQHGIRP